MDPTVSIDTLAWLVEHYTNAGRLEMAAATNATLMELFPEDEFATAAALWLMHYRTSGEVALWIRQYPDRMHTNHLRSSDGQQSRRAKLSYPRSIVRPKTSGG